MSAARFTVELADEAATVRLAEDLAAKLRVGDVLALHGDLGAGKTSLARALIRAMADNEALEVPSPTFTLVQTYQTRLPLAHFDLYRLGSPEELEELGFEEAFADGVALIEWPEKAGRRLPPERLDIALEISGAGRIATIEAGESWCERIERTLAIRAFLDRAGWRSAMRRHLQGDASYRAYERVTASVGSPTAVLMDAPGRRAEPGSYDDIAHRATEVRPFVAIGAALAGVGLSTPELLAADMDAGLLLVEDFGGEGVLSDGRPDPERYRVAAEALAHLHSEPRPAVVALPDGSTHVIPPFDAGAVTIEVNLLPQWYATHLDQEARTRFSAIWADLFRHFDAAEKSWVIRDVHSPNLLWLPERDGIRRIGFIDYQDAMVGPSAYDVASLLQDVRVTVPPDLEAALKAHYISERKGLGAFDETAFEIAYAIAAAQKGTKLLGGFSRLVAWGKPQYLRHIPRLKDYLRRTLSHPVLADLARWYDLYLPLD